MSNESIPISISVLLILQFEPKTLFKLSVQLLFFNLISFTRGSNIGYTKEYIFSL